jgi:hypothetical protein
VRVKGQLVADSAVQDFLGLVVCSPTDEKQRHFRRSHAFAMMYAAVWFRRICALQQCLALWYYTTRAGSKLVVVDDEPEFWRYAQEAADVLCSSCRYATV